MTAGDRHSTWLVPLSLGRFWVTTLWVVMLGVGLAGWEWGERRLRVAAADQTLVMLPESELDLGEREDRRRRMIGEPGVGDARWVAPADQVRRLARRHPEPGWRELLPEDRAWLPWVLEVRPIDPLGDPLTIGSFIARRKQEGGWPLALWDAERIGRLRDARRALRVGMGLWLALGALAGAAALARYPWPASAGAALIAWSILFGLAGPGAVWVALRLAGANPDPRSLMVALGAGFVLAGIVGPMIRKRRNREPSLTAAESEDARDG